MFAFTKKQTLAVSGHIIFHSKMNLIFVETFLEKSIYFTKKKKKIRKFTMAALGRHSHTTGWYWPVIESNHLHKSLTKLNGIMELMEDLEVLLAEVEHFLEDLTPQRKHYLMNNLSLTVPVWNIRYDKIHDFFYIGSALISNCVKFYLYNLILYMNKI